MAPKVSVFNIFLFSVLLLIGSVVFADADTNSPLDPELGQVVPDSNTESAELYCVLDVNDVSADKIMQYRNRVIRFLRKRLPLPNRVTAISKNKIKITLDLATAVGLVPAAAGTRGCVSQAASNSASSENRLVYVTKTGRCYHNKNCSSLRKSSKPMRLSEAKKKGYIPCKRCCLP